MLFFLFSSPEHQRRAAKKKDPRAKATQSEVKQRRAGVGTVMPDVMSNNNKAIHHLNMCFTEGRT